MKISIVAILCLFSSLLLSSQDYVSISGKIVDAETKAPLSFATIGIMNESIGVVTNHDGLFDLGFATKYLEDSIEVSMVGYEPTLLSARELIGKKFNVIEIKASPILLKEVVITPGKELSASEIVELVRNRIKDNYPQKPFEINAFYRDYKIEDGKCVGIFEADVSIYDKGYKNVPNPYSLQEKVKLNEVRKSLKNDFKANVLVNYNIMIGFLSLNDIRYRHRWLSKRLRKEFRYEKDRYTFINDRLMYVIKAISNDWKFKIYVDAEDFSVPKLEMDYVWEDDVSENEWTIEDSIRLEQRWAKEVLEFQKTEGMWLPKFHVFSTENITYDIETNEVLATTIVSQEFLVNKLDLRASEKPDKLERMNEEEPLHLQVPPYNPEFWENYNMIKLRPADEKLVEELEGRMKLEDQFRAMPK